MFGTSGGSVFSPGFFRGDGTTLVRIVREGQAAPDANGSFDNLETSPAFNDTGPAFNDTGQVAFWGELAGTSSGFNDNEGIFRGDGATLTQIVREGEAAPDANGSFSGFSNTPALNDAGQVAFRADLTGTSEFRGVFRGDGTMLTQIARTSDAAPDANGSFNRFRNHALNDLGQVAFRADLVGTSGGASDDEGIFRGDGTTRVQIVREGQAAPDANGSFLDFSFNYALNDAGQVAFSGDLTGTSGGSSDNSGLFRGDGTTLVQIAREGDAAPDANGSFSALFTPALNDAGQMAFWGQLTGTSGGTSDNSGLFFYDDGLGLIQVAREGDSLLGSTITALSFSNGLFGDEQSGLNELGQVAYQFHLAGGRSGVAIWTVPEPTALALLTTLGGPLLLARRQRA